LIIILYRCIKFLQVSGKFPETAWRAFEAPRQLIPFLYNSGFIWGTAWRHETGHQATQVWSPRFQGFVCPTRQWGTTVRRHERDWLDLGSSSCSGIFWLERM